MRQAISWPTYGPSAPGAMILMPRHVDKGSGITAAVEALGVGAHRVMAVGDGENDFSMLRAAGVRVAVPNAVPELGRDADYVTLEEDGKGLSEAVGRFCGPPDRVETPRSFALQSQGCFSL
jgi:hydroxymethylpyrimidine pyrophosphatase-like HAD family hydrolase